MATVTQTQQLLDPTIASARKNIFEALFGTPGTSIIPGVPGLGATPGLLDRDMPIPDYEKFVAGLTESQRNVFDQVAQEVAAGKGIGGYMPLLQDAIAGTQSADALVSGAAADIPAAQKLALGAADAADISDLTAEQAQIGRDFLAEANPVLQQGVASLSQASDLAQQGTAMYDPSMAEAYRTNFEQAVIDRARRDIMESGELARRQLDAQALGQGAFGGSRLGVERALTREAELEQIGDIAARLRAENEARAQQQAMQSFEAEQARLQAAGQAVGQVGAQQVSAAGATQALGTELAGILGSTAGQELQSAATVADIGSTAAGIAQVGGQLGVASGDLAAQEADLAAQMQGQVQSDLSTQLGYGQIQQAQDQAILDAQLRREAEEAMEPFTKVGIAADIVAGQPAGRGAVATVYGDPGRNKQSEQIGEGIALISAGEKYNPFGN